MKKIRTLLLIIAMLITIVPFMQKSTITVNAEKETYSYYSFNCGSNEYEVDTITDSGNFSKQGCYVDFGSAKSAMNSFSDAVVRSASSYSANQIIAMTNGFVYSNGWRDSSNIIEITQNGVSNPASTYIPNTYGMYYEDTVSYDGNGNGTVLVNAFGFEGYVELKDIDFIPEIYFVKDYSIWLGGNTAHSPETWSVTPVSMFYTVEQNGNYLDLVYHCYSDMPKNGNGSYATNVSYNISVGPAASWMKEGSYYYSLDDVNFYSDYNFKTFAGTYYNYYVFQPLRTKSKISTDVYNSFLEKYGYNSSSMLWNTGSIFAECQENYGINAAVTFAQACLESAYGTSDYALNENNLFGVGAYDNGANTKDFSSIGGIRKSIENQMGLLLRYYTDTNTVLYYGGFLGTKEAGVTTKYASAPFYGMSIAAVYYRLDKFANGYDGNLTDNGSTALGILNDGTIPVYTDASGSSVLYTYRYGHNRDYIKNQSVAIIGQQGDYYKIQSTDYVSGGSEMNLDDGTYATYSWSDMVGYVKKSDVKTIVGTVPSASVASIEMYRLYNPNSGEHLYTASASERDNLTPLGWVYEGIGWNAPETSNSPVYRLYNPNSGDHHYTLSADEKNWLVTLGWRDEGVGWYSDDNQTVPIYRQFNPNATIGTHNYTRSKDENDWLGTLGWHLEGIGWYGVN